MIRIAAPLTIAAILLQFGCTHRPPNKVECAEIANFDTLQSRRLIVLGELHGTREVPKFVSDLACNFAKRGIETIVALEIPMDTQPSIDAVLGSRIESTASAMSKVRHWTSTMRDGRSSEAMWNLILSIRAINAASNKKLTSVATFDVAPNSALSSIDQRESFMAGALRNIVMGAHKDTAILVLTGNVHSSKARGAPWNKEFESMTYLLRDLNPLSLDIAHDGGHSWSCTSGGCKSHAWRGRTDSSKLFPARGVYLDRPANGHDGVYYVGNISASPPLFAE
jgi:hypothetical protein